MQHINLLPSGSDFYLLASHVSNVFNYLINSCLFQVSESKQANTHVELPSAVIDDANQCQGKTDFYRH